MAALMALAALAEMAAPGLGEQARLVAMKVPEMYPCKSGNDLPRLQG